MVTAPIVWIDCEMTGLDLANDALIEIACIVTDAELQPLDEGIDLIIAPPAGALDTMDEVVTAMHTQSGLLAAMNEAVPLAEAEQRVLDYVRTHVPEPRKAPLGGSSVHVDRMFLARDMPLLTEHLHYRIVDVSSVKELVRRWFPRAYYSSPSKRGDHRALADIIDSIKELRYYRDVVFVPHPGPSTEQSRQAADVASAFAAAYSLATAAAGEDTVDPVQQSTHAEHAPSEEAGTA